MVNLRKQVLFQSTLLCFIEIIIVQDKWCLDKSIGQTENGLKIDRVRTSLIGYDFYVVSLQNLKGSWCSEPVKFRLPSM